MGNDGYTRYIPLARFDLEMTMSDPFDVKNVYFNNPVTVVIWEDGTKTIVRCDENDIYDPEKGLAMAISKKALGNKGNYYNTFKDWLPEEVDSEEGYSYFENLINEIRTAAVTSMYNLNIPKL